MFNLIKINIKITYRLIKTVIYQISTVTMTKSIRYIEYVPFDIYICKSVNRYDSNL